MQKKDLITVLMIVIFFSSFSLNFVDSEITDNYSEVDFSTDSYDDFDISLETNQTMIGLSGGVLGTLSMTNNAINHAGNISVDFSYSGEYTEFTSTYSTHQEIALLNPGASTNFNIELILNDTLLNPDNSPDVVDLCLCFDSSGSMTNELAEVQAEFIALTDRLTQSISSLRIGMIVYGWNKYDEFPTESPNNYIEFTDDYQSINTFISSMEAHGSIEPWGDALYLASTWDWRNHASKLIILIGDEDCDEGLYVNISTLDSMVSTLGEMGIQINSVMTEEADSTVKQQFIDVAESTGGVMIDLLEIASGTDPLSLTEVIEDMTLSLTREFFINLQADVNWTEYTSTEDLYHFTQKSIVLLVDLAPPSVTVSTYIIENIDATYSLDVFVTPLDVSGILTTQIIWTDDDLTSNPSPIWHLTIPSLEFGDTYMETFSGLLKDSKFSFYVIAIDTCYNLGTTEIYNLTIQTEPKDFGTTIEFGFLENNSFRRIYFNMSDIQPGYLLVETNDLLEISFEDLSDFSFTKLMENGNATVYQVTPLNTKNIFSVVFSGNTSSSVIKIRWNYILTYSQNQFEYSSWFLYEYQTDVLLKVTLTDPRNGYLSIIVHRYSALNLKVHVFDSAWNELGVISPAKAIELRRGDYYLWAVRVIREGEFQIFYGKEAMINEDPYYTYVSGFPFFSIFALFILGLSSISLAVFRKRKN